MHAIAEAGDKRTGLHRDREVGGVILVAGADPPRTGEHHGEKRTRVHVRAGEIGAFEHGEHLYKQARLVRIAGEARQPKTSAVLPPNLVGAHDWRSRLIAAPPRATARWNLV